MLQDFKITSSSDLSSIVKEYTGYSLSCNVNSGFFYPTFFSNLRGFEESLTLKFLSTGSVFSIAPSNKTLFFALEMGSPLLAG